MLGYLKKLGNGASRLLCGLVRGSPADLSDEKLGAGLGWRSM